MFKKIYPLLILLLAVALRFGTVFKLLVFTPDEVYQAYLAQTIIKNFHIIWIGISAGSFGMFLGPLWIYVIYPFLAVFKGDPVVLGYIASAFGVGATFLLYRIGKKLFSQKVGLIASLLYAALPILVYYDQKPYPSAVTFLSLLIFLSIYMSKYSNLWWTVFAAAYGFVFHVHLSLVLLILPAIYWAWTYRKNINRKTVFLSVCTFVLTISPLIAFDYFHKGSNIGAPLGLLKTAASGSVKLPASYHFDSLFNSLGRLWYLAPFKNNSDEILYFCTKSDLSTYTRPPWLISVLSLGLFLYLLLRKATWKDEKTRLLMLFCLVFVASYTFAPFINPYEYYLLGFFPLFLLLISSLFDAFKKPVKVFAYILVFVVVIGGIFTSFSASGDFGLETKKNVVAKTIGLVGNHPYTLESDGDCHKYEGWRYIFSVYGRAPERSDEDSTFAWLYPEEVTQTPADYLVVVKETRAPTEVKPGYKYSFIEGGFSVFIYEP